MKRKFFICISILFAILTGSIAVSANDNQKWTKEDCEASISFIKNHISEFVQKYNESEDMSEKLNASYVEYSALLWLVEDDNYGVYIDFDGNNGYLVMTGNYTIYALQTTGDYPEFQTQNDLYYSYIDGFLLQDENGNYQKYGSKTTMSPVTTAEPSDSAVSDGYISSTELNEHVNTYHSYYTLESIVQPFSGTFEFSHQVNTSYYVSYNVDKDGNNLSNKQAEGNCSLNSCFTLLRDWQKRGYVSGLPEGKINKRGDIEKEYLYSTYGVGKVWLQTEDDNLFNFRAGQYYKWEKNDQALQGIPILYDEIREYAVGKLNYTPISGLSDKNVKEIMYSVLAKYGNSVTLVETDAISTAAIQINNNKACYLSVNNSYTYQVHAMVVVGYRKYSYESGWWIFKTKQYAYYLEVADGFDKFNSYYFDPRLSPTLEMNFIYLNQ